MTERVKVRCFCLEPVAGCRGRCSFANALASTVFLGLLVLTSCQQEVPLDKFDTKGAAATASCQTGPIRLSAAEMRRMGLTTANVEEKDVPVELQLAAAVEANANMSTPVHSLVPGKVEQVTVSIGDNVKKGDVLASLRSDDVAQIEADFLDKYLDMQAERNQRLLEQELAVKSFNRKRVLLEERIAARADVEAAETDLLKAQAAIRSIDGKLEAEREGTTQRLRVFGIPESEVDRLIQTRQIEHSFDITAPRTGFIAKRDVDPGQNIDTERDLFVVTDLSEVWLVAHVFEKDIDDIELGDPATATVETWPGDAFRGKLDYIGNNLDPDTRTLPVRATVVNRGTKLKPQMFARLSVVTGHARELCVPSGAVQKVGEVWVAYVQTAPDTFAERKLEIGLDHMGFTPVRKGLRPGERVVVKGSLQLLGQALQRLSQ